MAFITPDSRDLKTAYVTDYQDIDNLATTGTLWLWGNNNVGQLGDNTVVLKSTPVQTIAAGNNWSQISISNSQGVTAENVHVMAVKTNGTLWGWGCAALGRLGNNVNTNTRYSSPIQTVAGGTNWKLVDCGYSHNAAIKTDGTLWTWGVNDDGRLGDNTVLARSSPVQTVAGGTNWSKVSCGQQHTLGLKTDGSLWTWGSGNFGQLGNGDGGTFALYSSPTLISGTWKQISASHYTSAGITTAGQLFTWGYNVYGQLGDDTRTNRSYPTQTVAGGTNWKYVSVCFQHTVAIKTDGTLWTWGFNSSGQLGDGTTTRRSSPVQVVSGGTNWKVLNSSKSAYHTAAIKTDGTLWSWGYGYHNNGFGSYSSPVQIVAMGTNCKQVAIGGYYPSITGENGENCVGVVYYYDADKTRPPA